MREHHSSCSRRNSLLQPCAIACAGNVRRVFSEPHPKGRTCFQRDRDRLLHSEAFRRLGYKTQVFVVHEGDFYRTRLTHTLEVAQIARGFATALEANEDVCEGAALAHDLGHPPYGHRGEHQLDELIRHYVQSRGEGSGLKGRFFEQNFQSYRIVAELEQRYANFDGLNLSEPLLETILRHQTEFDKPTVSALYEQVYPDAAAAIRARFPTPQPSMETQIVNLADQVAWVTHDLEDALRVRFIDRNDLMARKNTLLKEASQKVDGSQTNDILWCRQLIRNMIHILIMAASKETQTRIQTESLSSPAAIRNKKEAVVKLPESLAIAVEDLRQFLMDGVYTHPLVERMSHKAVTILERLFNILTRDLQEKDPYGVRLLPRSTQAQVMAHEEWPGRLMVIVDFMAGMTDRFALDLYQSLFSPKEKNITHLF